MTKNGLFFSLLVNPRRACSVINWSCVSDKVLKRNKLYIPDTERIKHCTKVNISLNLHSVHKIIAQPFGRKMMTLPCHRASILFSSSIHIFCCPSPSFWRQIFNRWCKNILKLNWSRYHAKAMNILQKCSNDTVSCHKRYNFTTAIS